MIANPKLTTKMILPDDLYGAGVYVELSPGQTWYAKQTTRYFYIHRGWGVKLRLTPKVFYRLFTIVEE